MPTARSSKTSVPQSEASARSSSAGTRCATRPARWRHCKHSWSDHRGCPVEPWPAWGSSASRGRLGAGPRFWSDHGAGLGRPRPKGTAESALLAGVQEVLRVEGLLDPVVQVVACRAELRLELAALQPADAVLAADRSAEAQRELEQVAACVVGAPRFVEVVGREEECRVDVAVARVTER